MRPIKFRAWHKCTSGGEMYKWGEFSISDQEIYLHDGQTNWEHNYFELMQYTGLQDSYGKEIYEGDIIQVYNTVGIVEYSDTGYGLKYNDGNTIGLYSWHTKKVIGNIYENPKLYHDTVIKNLPF